MFGKGLGKLKGSSSSYSLTFLLNSSYPGLDGGLPVMTSRDRTASLLVVAFGSSVVPGIYAHLREKTNSLGFRPGPSFYINKHRNFGYK